jgi:PEGA domain
LSGWVQISSPVVAQLFEQGRLLGTTETDRIMLPVGQHEVTVAIPALDFNTSTTLAVVAGKTTTFNVRLPTGRLYVNAIPWADVWIDGQRVGETPLANVSLPIGPHELLFRHPQFGDRRQTVTVKSSGITRIGLELGK